MVIRLFSMVAIISLGFHSSSAEMDSKQRILQKIQEHIQNEKQELQLFKDNVNSNKTAKLAIDPQRISRNLETRIRALEIFYKLAKEKSPTELNTLLVQVFRSCNSQGSCQHELNSDSVKDFLIAAGNLVLDQLFSSWKDLPDFQKEILMKASANTMPVVCREAILEQARVDSSTRVRSFSLNVSQLTCNSDAFKKHIKLFLSSEKNEELLLYGFEFLKDDSSWFEQVVQAVQKGRIKIESSQSQICSSQARVGKIDNDEKIDVGFWLNAFQKQNYVRQSCIAESIFLKLKSRSQLLKLHQIFQDAVESKFQFQSTVVLNDRIRRSSVGGYWSEIPGRDQSLLEQFQKNLTSDDLKSWRDLKQASFAEKIILTKWLKEDPKALVPQNVKLKIQIYSDKKELLSESVHPVVLNQAFHLKGLESNKNIRAIDYQGVVQFDPESLTYKIEMFLVELKPSGAAFKVSIPISGKFEAALLENGNKYIWNLSVQ